MLAGSQLRTLIFKAARGATGRYDLRWAHPPHVSHGMLFHTVKLGLVANLVLLIGTFPSACSPRAWHQRREEHPSPYRWRAPLAPCCVHRFSSRPSSARFPSPAPTSLLGVSPSRSHSCVGLAVKASLSDLAVDFEWWRVASNATASFDATQATTADLSTASSVHLHSGRSRYGHGTGWWAQLHDNPLGFSLPTDEASRRQLVLLVLVVRIAYAALHVFCAVVPSRRRRVAACLGST